MTPQDFESFPVFGDNSSKVQPGEQKYAAGFVPGDVLPAEWLNWFLNTISKGYNQLVQHANEGFVKTISTSQPLTPTQEMSVVIDTAGVTLTLGSGPYTGYTLPVLATAACSVAYTGSGGSTTDTLAAGNARQYVWAGSAWLIVTQPTLTAGTGIDITDTTISAKQTYSTSEVKTGDVWIDGKPIYRQVFTGTLTSYTDASTRRTFSTGVSNWTSTHTFIRAYGSYKVSQGNVYNLGSNHQSGTNTSFFSDAIGPEGTSLNLRFYSAVSQGITSVEYNVVVEYTKTTD